MIGVSGQVVVIMNKIELKMKIQDDNLLTIFVKKMKSELDDNLKEIILFGSRARGDNTPDSDYDCMAVFDNLSPSLTDIIDEIAGEFLYEYNVVFAVFPVSENQRLKQICNPLFMNIEKEGIVL